MARFQNYHKLQPSFTDFYRTTIDQTFTCNRFGMSTVQCFSGILRDSSDSNGHDSNKQHRQVNFLHVAKDDVGAVACEPQKPRRREPIKSLHYFYFKTTFAIPPFFGAQSHDELVNKHTLSQLNDVVTITGIIPARYLLHISKTV